MKLLIEQERIYAARNVWFVQSLLILLDEDSPKFRLTPVSDLIGLNSYTSYYYK